MSSTFTQKKKKSTGFLTNSAPDKVWLQFVPGNVIEVIQNTESAGYTAARDINAVIAKPHITEDLRNKSSQNKKYFPLFRGIVDVPAKGDPVLLCTFGGINYYMGPINTINNPTWNFDHMNMSDSPIRGQKNTSSAAAKKGISKGLRLSKTSRLQKPYIDEFDWSSYGGNPQAIRDIPGDLMLEGRQGNSIRIGARDVNPYIIISNGRGTANILESTTDGSIFAMFNKGKLREYFPYDTKPEGQDGEIEELRYVTNPFVLASDSVDEPKRLIGEENYNYDYEKSQIFQNSRKITINAKEDSIFLSAFQNVWLGAGTSINIVSNRETIIEASNIYLGRAAEKEKEPLVLGDQLLKTLEEIVDIFTSLKVTGTIGGISGPVDLGTEAKVKTLQSKLKNPGFFSNYHFIEPNGSK